MLISKKQGLTEPLISLVRSHVSWPKLYSTVSLGHKGMMFRVKFKLILIIVVFWHDYSLWINVGQEHLSRVSIWQIKKQIFKSDFRTNDPFCKILRWITIRLICCRRWIVGWDHFECDSKFKKHEILHTFYQGPAANQTLSFISVPTKVRSSILMEQNSNIYKSELKFAHISCCKFIRAWITWRANSCKCVCRDLFLWVSRYSY